MKIVMAVPVYKKEHPVHLAARELTMRRLGDQLVVYRQVGDSCLARARATLLGAALHHVPDFTHLLQVDDDQSWTPDHLLKLVDLDLPLVGLPCSFKFDEPHPYAGFCTIRGIPGEGPDERLVQRVKYLGGGFILWRRDCLDGMMRMFPDLGFDTNAPDVKPQATFDFWSTRVVGRELLSEDYSACDWAKRAGFRPHAWFGACSPHWRNPPEDLDDPTTWKGYVPKGYNPQTVEFRKATPEELEAHKRQEEAA